MNVLRSEVAVPTCVPIWIQDSAVTVFLDTNWIPMARRACKVGELETEVMKPYLEYNGF